MTANSLSVSFYRRLSKIIWADNLHKLVNQSFRESIWTGMLNAHRLWFVAYIKLFRLKASGYDRLVWHTGRHLNTATCQRSQLSKVFKKFLLVENLYKSRFYNRAAAIGLNENAQETKFGSKYSPLSSKTGLSQSYSSMTLTRILLRSTM